MLSSSQSNYALRPLEVSLILDVCICVLQADIWVSGGSSTEAYKRHGLSWALWLKQGRKECDRWQAVKTYMPTYARRVREGEIIWSASIQQTVNKGG